VSLEFVMNAGGALGHASGSLVSGGVFTVISTPSTKVSAGGSGAHRGPLKYTFAGGSAAGFVSGTVATTAPQTIESTAKKVLADGLLVIRLGDSGEMTASGSLTGGGTGSVIGLVEVADAGQNKVSAQ